METLIFDVMLDGRFIRTMKYRYCSAAPIEEEDIARFVTDRLPTLKAKTLKLDSKQNF